MNCTEKRLFVAFRNTKQSLIYRAVYLAWHERRYQINSEKSGFLPIFQGLYLSLRPFL